MDSLCDLLDTLEAAFLRLRDERDELRAKKKPPAKKKAKKKAAAKKKAVTKAAKPEKKETAPKPPSKPRQALGRSLLQIRPRRES